MRRWLFSILSVYLVTTGCNSKEQSPQKQITQIAPSGPETKDATPARKSYDGPFGLAIGEPMNELSFVEGGGDLTQARMLASVPRPMSDIESYAVIAYPETGICEIRAVGKSFDSDAYGNNVKASIDAMAEVLDAKYGKHRKVNRCDRFSCEFFQQGLNDGSTAYFYEWSRAAGSKIEPAIQDITLIAMAGDFNGTYWRLDYTSSHSSECKAAKAKTKAAAL